MNARATVMNHQLMYQGLGILIVRIFVGSLQSPFLFEQLTITSYFPGEGRWFNSRYGRFVMISCARPENWKR